MEMITMKKLISVALALVMIFALTATVAAKDSPVAKDYYSISVGYSPADGSLGTASADKSSVMIIENEDGTVTLTAVTKGDGVFEQWTIDGEYEIVSGSLTDPVIVIRPKSDINAVAQFKTSGSSTPDSSSSKPSSSGGSDSKSSPKTGDPIWMVLGLAVLALGAGTLAVKKIKE